jgi:hypothetical protein
MCGKSILSVISARSGTELESKVWSPAFRRGMYANTMNTKTSNTLDATDDPPAKAGTPNFFDPHGVPPSGGARWSWRFR